MAIPSHGSDSPRVLVAAFEGWSDAGAATTTVLQHLAERMGAEPLYAISAEGYIDFQVHRPKVSFDDEGRRVLDWPDTKLYGEVQRPGAQDLIDELVESDAETVRRIDGSRVTNLFLLAGVEPARDWRSYADEILELVDVWGIDLVIMLGSMFSDAPHSRPIVTHVSSETPERRTDVGAERSSYEGPVGILTVVDLALVEAGIETISLWAQVPHYVHSSPSPKVTLALLDKLEELLDIVIPRGELLAEATEWESNIDRIAATDEDMSSYIRGLEESRDASMAAGTTGDALALEFEKFLGSGTGHQTPSSLDEHSGSPEEPAADGSSDDASESDGTEPGNSSDSENGTED